MTDPDLFGNLLPPAPPVERPQLTSAVLWSRISTIKKPRCGHCTMLVHAGGRAPINDAHWTRIGRDGSVLDLCEGHKVHQQELDLQVEGQDRDAQAYAFLRDGIIATMDDPDSWDGDEAEESLLLRYVEWLSLKLCDINTILDRDVA